MPDRDGTLNMTPDPALAAALRALPDVAPQPDLWPDLACTLDARRRPRTWRYAIPFAIAAAIALLILSPHRLPNHAAPEGPTVTDAGKTNVTVPPVERTSVVATTADTEELAGLHQRSQSLERWIAEFSAHAPQDSRDLMAAVEVEDMIGLVDLQLDAARNPDDALPLWKQRVALLEDLATIRGKAFAVAANDDVRSRGAAPQRLN